MIAVTMTKSMTHISFLVDTYVVHPRERVEGWLVGEPFEQVSTGTSYIPAYVAETPVPSVLE